MVLGAARADDADDRHGVSVNASMAGPAKLLGFFVVDTKRDGVDDAEQEAMPPRG
jgi:hypothetical protein